MGMLLGHCFLSRHLIERAYHIMKTYGIMISLAHAYAVVDLYGAATGPNADSIVMAAERVWFRDVIDNVRIPLGIRPMDDAPYL